MAHITHDEVRKLAAISQITVDEQEVAHLAQELKNVLDYAACLAAIAQAHKNKMSELPKNINVFRNDEVLSCDSSVILDQAPEREENYFVVPVILKH